MLVVAIYETAHLSYIAPTREEGRLGFVAEIVVRILLSCMVFVYLVMHGIEEG